MITPRFSCEQTVEAIIVSVHCPAIRVRLQSAVDRGRILILCRQASEVEITVEDCLFTLHVNPYFLRLNFSHPLLEDDEDSSANYDASSGTLVVNLKKAVPGQQFDDLDLLAKLLAPQKAAQPRKPVIEVVDSDESTDPEESIAAQVNALRINEDPELAGPLNNHFSCVHVLRLIGAEAERNNWQIHQTIQDETPVRLSKESPYGFLNSYHGYFTHVADKENEVNDLSADAETLSPSDRRIRRMRREDTKWDEEHYLQVTLHPNLSWLTLQQSRLRG